MDFTNQLHEIEWVIHRAWPARIIQPYENWLLRAHEGVTKRANSVFTVGAMPQNKHWLKEIEAFYEAQQITPCFYMSALSPKQLDEILFANHYQQIGFMDLMLAHTERVLQFYTDNPDISVQIDTEVTPRWIERFLQLEQFAAHLSSAYEKIFTALPGKKAFVTIYKDEMPVAVASVAVEQPYGYVANVVVAPSYRRQRLATHLLTNLAKWAEMHGVKYFVLQVVTENEAAQKLYQQLHFTKLAQSYYWMKQ